MGGKEMTTEEVYKFYGPPPEITKKLFFEAIQAKKAPKPPPESPGHYPWAVTEEPQVTPTWVSPKVVAGLTLEKLIQAKKALQAGNPMPFPDGDPKWKKPPLKPHNWTLKIKQTYGAVKMEEGKTIQVDEVDDIEPLWNWNGPGKHSTVGEEDFWETLK